MKIIKQLFIIILFSMLGEFISLLCSKIMVIPGSIIGMLLLFFALHYKWIKMESVEETGTWLTSNMALFFVPAGVSLISDFDILARTWWQLAIMVVVTTILMIIITGLVVQQLKKRFDNEGGGKDNVE